MVAKQEEKTPEAREQGVGVGEVLRLALIVGAVVLVFILIFQNQESVSTRFFFWSLEMPRFLVLAAAFVLGIFAGYAAARRRARRRAGAGSR